MALGTTNISLHAVNTELGKAHEIDGSIKLFNVGTSNLINKWSKYKPIRSSGDGQTEGQNKWPTGVTNGNSGRAYGLNLPTDWSYLQPRGGSPGGATDEPVRLGDFRGYEHSSANAYPTLRAIEGSNPVQNLHPINGPVTIDWILSSHDDASSVLIRPTDLGFQDYYYGIKIYSDDVPAGVTTMYKTFAQVHDVPDTGTTFAIQATYDINTNTFANLPFGSGTYSYELFISSNATPYVGGYYQWSTNAPLDMTMLPHEGSFIAYGSFDVALFIYLSTPDMDWTYSEYGSTYEKAVEIGSMGIYEWTHVPSNSGTGWSVFNHTQADDPVAEFDEGDSGDVIHVYPNQANASRTTDKTETLELRLRDNTSVTAVITLTQTKDDSPIDPIVGYANNTVDSWNISNIGGSIAISSTTMYYSFTHDFGGVEYYTVTVRDAANNVVYGPTGGFGIEFDFPNVSGSLTLNRAAVGGDVFTMSYT